MCDVMYSGPHMVHTCDCTILLDVVQSCNQAMGTMCLGDTCSSPPHLSQTCSEYAAQLKEVLDRGVISSQT